MSWLQPIRIVGVGSPHGDDAVGWEVIQRLRKALGSVPGVEIIRLEGGQRLLDLLDGKGSIILVDALSPAGSPGTIRRLDWPTPCIQLLRPGSTHDMNPAEALQLAKAIGQLPERVVIFGIEMEQAEPGAELSPGVAAAVPDLVRTILAELRR